MRTQVKKILTAIFIILALSAGPSYGTTLVLRGDISDEIEISHSRSFKLIDGRLDSLTFRFYNPSDFKSGAVTQRVSARKVSYAPEPESVQAEKDSFGNSYTVVTWRGLKGEVTVVETYKVSLSIGLNEARSLAPFPLPSKDMPREAMRFLKPSPLVEADAPTIKKLASTLVTGASTEQAAVDAILNWVVDNVKYRSPVEDYGAGHTLATREGNCQNFAHLAIALLRSVGIPARIAGGVSLGRPWKVPVEGGHLVQSIGQGGHAWMEVWYPDLGWAPYDAQQSRLFVGPRHIRQTAGMDSNDINDSWRASPKLPRFSENISAEYLRDDIAISLKESYGAPSSYVMASSLPKAGSAITPPLPIMTVEPPKPAPEGKAIEIGNTVFAPLTDFYANIRADSGQRTFDKETAEYVTGEHTFAQAFVVDAPMTVNSVSLAMHKFGGRLGSLWIDVVNDAGGRPGMEGVRSLPLPLDTVAYHPGYKWFGFRFGGSDGPVLKPGRYWIILRKSRDAVVSWAYTPGNRYNGPDDARSTEAGIDWPNIMNYDFNFRVTGASAVGDGGG